MVAMVRSRAGQEARDGVAHADAADQQRGEADQAEELGQPVEPEAEAAAGIGQPPHPPAGVGEPALSGRSWRRPTRPAAGAGDTPR